MVSVSGYEARGLGSILGYTPILSVFFLFLTLIMLKCFIYQYNGIIKMSKMVISDFFLWRNVNETYDCGAKISHPERKLVW